MGSANPHGNVLRDFPGYAKYAIAAVLAAACLGPTFISYKPIILSWDDADYLVRAVAASRALWSGDTSRLGAAVVSVHTPAMALLGLPYGPIEHWDQVGVCFFSLALLIAALASACLYMMLRIGVKPIFLVAASLCVAAALGGVGVNSDRLYATHTVATGFMADNLLAWVILAAVLLLPFEARTAVPSLGSAAVRGAASAAIFSLGALTKVSFLYFLVLILPLLLFMRLRNYGIRNVLLWLGIFLCCSSPTAGYFLRYGRSALTNAQAASFGGLAVLYHVPAWKFLAGITRESPGLALELALLIAASSYILIEKRLCWSDSVVIAFLIVLGFLVIVFASPSRFSRYLFPAIVAFPFLLAILVSEKKYTVPTPVAGLGAGLILAILAIAAVPTRYRDFRQSLTRAEVLMAQAERWNANNVILATDSPTLNAPLLRLALEFSPRAASVETLAYRAISRVPLDDDFRFMRQADIVVLQESQHTNPKFTNQRVPEYEAYLRRTGASWIKVAEDVYLYRTSPDSLLGKGTRSNLSNDFLLGEPRSYAITDRPQTSLESH